MHTEQLELVEYILINAHHAMLLNSYYYKYVKYLSLTPYHYPAKCHINI